MPALLTPEQQHEIGCAVLRARAGGCPWKLLENTYDRSRMQLWRYASAAGLKDVTSGQMLHLQRCGAEEAAA